MPRYDDGDVKPATPSKNSVKSFRSSDSPYMLGFLPASPASTRKASVHRSPKKIEGNDETGELSEAKDRGDISTSPSVGRSQSSLSHPGTSRISAEGKDSLDLLRAGGSNLESHNLKSSHDGSMQAVTADKMEGGESGNIAPKGDKGRRLKISATSSHPISPPPREALPSTPLPRTSSPLSSPSLSRSTTASPNSILNRPRPQLSDVHSRSSSATPSPSVRRFASSPPTSTTSGVTSSRPNMRAPHTLSPLRSEGRPGSPSLSLLDRPRPWTPERQDSSNYDTPVSSTSTRNYSRPLNLAVPTPLSAPPALLRLDIAPLSNPEDSIFDLSSYFGSPDQTSPTSTEPISKTGKGEEGSDVGAMAQRQRAPLTLAQMPMLSTRDSEMDAVEPVAEEDPTADYYGEITPTTLSFHPTPAPVTALPPPPPPLSSAVPIGLPPQRTTSLSTLSSSNPASNLDAPSNSIPMRSDSHLIDTNNRQVSSISLQSSASNVSTDSLASSGVSSREASPAIQRVYHTSYFPPDLPSLNDSYISSDLTPLDKSLPPTPSFSPLPYESSPPIRNSPSPAREATIKSIPLLRQLSRLRRKGEAKNTDVPSNDAEFFASSLDRQSSASPTRSRSASPELTKSNFGKRLIGRFASSKQTLASSSSSVTSVDSTRSQIIVRKDSSDSIDLIMSGRELDEKKKKKRSAALLGMGMGLLAGRKSDNALARVGSSTSESSTRPAIVGRRSLDIFSSRNNTTKSIVRKPSSDNLLTLATSKLSLFATKVTATSPLRGSPIKDSSSPQLLSPSPAGPVPSLQSLERPPVKSLHSKSTGSTAPISTNLRDIAVANVISLPLSPSDKRVARSIDSTVQTRKGPDRVIDSGTGSRESVAITCSDLRTALITYTKNEEPADQGSILASTVLAFLKREESMDKPDDHESPEKRNILFEWLSILTDELRDTQPAHRGVCLETVAAIAESRLFSASLLQQDTSDEAKYRSAVVKLLSFAISKLNDKAVYANTLVLSGRILALAFFRIEGVALKLLRSLPSVKHSFLKRILLEVGTDEHHLPTINVDQFPSHLRHLCLLDYNAYTALLVNRRPQSQDDHFLVQDGDIEVAMSGNWLIRWNANDSDLPFAFYRSYHRQLASYLVPVDKRSSLSTIEPLSPSSIICAPAFLFLSASLLEKCDALVHRNLRSVTSIGPGNGANFNTNDSANLEIGRKPKVLELANRRIVSTLLDLVGGPPISTSDAAGTTADTLIRRYAFSAMLPIWIRATVKKTSMYDTRSVFILLDLLEGLIYTLSYPTTTEKAVIDAPDEACLKMFDIPFIFSFVRKILENGDNTVVVTRMIAFVYAHFELLTLRKNDRNELCEKILLDETIFQRHYLSWNGSIRSYFIRLLVWRVARLGIDRQIKDPDVVALFGLLNIRLETIRRRHDELEPADMTIEDELYRPKRSTICSTRAEIEAPYVVDELISRVEDDSESGEDSDVVVTKRPDVMEVRDSTASKSRVISWIKVGFGKAKTNSKVRGIAGSVEAYRFDDNSTSINPEELRRDSISTLEAFEDDSNFNIQSDRLNTGPLPSPPIEEFQPLIELRPRPSSPAFFSFEFESGSPPVSPLPSTSSSSLSNLSETTGLPSSPKLSNSNRQSRRFTKRQSILPPAALQSLAAIGETFNLVVPDEYKQHGYEKRLHCYAIRGLRDYEDALDEWTDWVIRLREEDGDQPLSAGFIDEVPRLSVAWQAGFE